MEKRKNIFKFTAFLLAALMVMSMTIMPVTTYAATKPCKSHSYVLIGTSEGNCKHRGTKVYKCKKCKKEKYVTGNYGNHKYSKSRHTVDTRNYRQTYEQSTCKICGHTTKTTISYHQHSYRYVDGKKSCKICNKIYR